MHERAKSATAKAVTHKFVVVRRLGFLAVARQMKTLPATAVMAITRREVDSNATQLELRGGKSIPKTNATTFKLVSHTSSKLSLLLLWYERRLILGSFQFNVHSCLKLSSYSIYIYAEDILCSRHIADKLALFFQHREGMFPIHRKYVLWYRYNNNWIREVLVCLTLGHSFHIQTWNSTQIYTCCLMDLSFRRNSTIGGAVARQNSQNWNFENKSQS